MVLTKEMLFITIYIKAYGKVRKFTSLHIPQRGKTDFTIIVYLGYRSIGRLCCAAGGKDITLE